jgi:TalC/MipB family fructose-6-phosphate aldolase
MHLYLDTADRAAAEPLLATGLFTGVTTNPSILRAASLGVTDIPGVYRWAVGAGAKEVFFQAWGEDTGTLVERGLRLRELGREVVVKVVASRAGAAACAELAARGVPTLLTAVYAPAQAVIAAAAGATYIAPYLGKLEDAGREAMADVVAMHEILTATGSATRVLLASIRDTSSVVAFARHGVGHFTMKPVLAEEFFADDLTAQAARDFEEAVAATAT